MYKYRNYCEIARHYQIYNVEKYLVLSATSRRHLTADHLSRLLIVCRVTKGLLMNATPFVFMPFVSPLVRKSRALCPRGHIASVLPYKAVSSYKIQSTVFKSENWTLELYFALQFTHGKLTVRCPNVLGLS